MRIQPQKPARQQGSVLIVTLVVAFILGAALCSYLVLISSQDRSVVRSQNWNAALAMAEAGVEDALAQVNSNTNAVDMTYLSANGWAQSGAAYGPVSRNLNGGFYSVSFVTNPTPTIYSTGYVTVPITGAQVSRKLKVTTLVLPLINVPLGAVDDINMNGNGAATDSWNSYDTNMSNSGQYDSSRTSSNGSVASINGVVSIGNHNILGNLYLGPNASYASGTGQVSGTIFYDYNIQFPDVALPAPTNGFWPSPSDAGNTVHDFTTSGNYLMDDSIPIKVEPGVRVTLDVRTPNFHPGGVTILGGLTNSGTLTIYQETGTATLAGNGSGPGSRPDNFWYYGLPGVTAVTLSGNTTFIGVIYAPEASLTLNGGGAANNLEGSAIVRSVTMNGHYDFHYDMSLLTNGPIRGYVPASWQEL